jgi:hypothetical protein
LGSTAELPDLNSPLEPQQQNPSNQELRWGPSKKLPPQEIQRRELRVLRLNMAGLRPDPFPEVGMPSPLMTQFPDLQVAMRDNLLYVPGRAGGRDS